MAITKQTVADKIAAYLRHEISLTELVDWAEEAMMEGEFAEKEVAAVSGVVSRLGVADGAGMRARSIDSYFSSC